jgi:septum formation protein
MGVILASGSSIRHQLLVDAAVEHRVIASEIDEGPLKGALLEPDQIALGLARMKAMAVSKVWPDDEVIGSDSIVTVAGRRFDKPVSRDTSAEHLRFFSGKTLILTSAVALAHGGHVCWEVADQAKLQVRRLSEAFIHDYLDHEWPDVAYCVGAFRLEARGVQLFDRIDGDYFTILGMPLIPLLGALRERGLLLA